MIINHNLFVQLT